MERLQIDWEMHAAGGDGSFYLSRAEAVLPLLLKQYAGQVQLIYLDPPFGTGDTFLMQLGTEKPIALPAYEDTLSREDYLAMMRTVLTGCRELLCDTGSIYLHIDQRMSAHLKLLMDELFGEENFLNEIIWMYKSGGRSKKHFSRKHDTILFYRKSPRVYFDVHAVGVPRGPDRRNHMKRSIDENGRICFSIRSGGKTYTYHEDTPIYPADVWTDIEHLHQRDPERVGYATQKPLALLRRIIGASSRPGDLVCDLFSGSGTTAAAAAEMGRRYLVCDCSPLAAFAFRKRQLSRHAALSMLRQEQPMALYYTAGDDCCNDSVNCSAVSLPDGVRITEYRTAEGDLALAYAAVGSCRENTFETTAYAFHPTLPLTLLYAKGSHPAILTVDAHGRQCFWKL